LQVRQRLSILQRSAHPWLPFLQVEEEWKEYFEDLLNPTNTPSSEEVGPGDLGIGSHISRAVVAEVVKKLLGGKAPGVDEIRPEFLKALDVVGLSWLTRLYNIAWTSGAVPLDWQTGVSNFRFRRSNGTVDQLYTLSRVFEGAWEFAQPVHMCFVGIRLCPLGGVLREYGVSGPLIRAVRSLYNRCQSLVHIAGNDLALLACDLQLSLDRFATACEAAGMKIKTSKSEAMVLNRKKVACLLRVKEEILPQVEEFKYLGVLFTSEGRLEQEINRWIGAASAVMQTLHRSVLVKRVLRYMVVADPNAGQDTVVHLRVPKPDAVPLDCRELGTPVHRRVPKPDAVPLDCRELGTPVSPQHAAVLLDRRGLGSLAQHARLTNVPRDTEGRGSPPRSGPPGDTEQERPSRKTGSTGIGAALQGNRNTGTGANTKEPKQAPTQDQQTYSLNEQTPRH
ncbi:hypothetical protein D4764_08G0002130, partial [Takifugu flavidus]